MLNRFSIFIFSIGCLFTLQVKAQQTHSLVLNIPDAYTECSIFNKVTQPASVDTACWYFWLNQNTLESTKGGFAGKLLHGPYTCFYNSHALKEKGNFYYGVKDGEWKKWTDKGEIAEITHWKRGRKEGKSEWHNPDGTLSVANYKNNRLNGSVLQYSSNGTLISEKKYKENKEIIKEPSRPSAVFQYASSTGSKIKKGTKKSWLWIKEKLRKKKKQKASNPKTPAEQSTQPQDQSIQQTPEQQKPAPAVAPKPVKKKKKFLIF